MPRRLLSLLAFLLLILASQAVAGDKGDEGEEDEEGGRDGHNRHDGKERRHDDREDEDRGDEDGEGEGGRRHAGKGMGDRDAQEMPRERESSRKQVSDAALTVLPTALPGRAQFSFLASSVAAADGMTLHATLPDTGSPWSLSGPSAATCRLAGRVLDCVFEGLAPGDVRLVQAASSIARAPPWELVAEGAVATTDDAAARNNEARAGLGLLLP
ncbi:MAG: hypothetical protein ACYC2H_10080 [Thermoplasmatota archaeon]